jgi:hypothetical protein
MKLGHHNCNKAFAETPNLLGLLKFVAAVISSLYTFRRLPKDRFAVAVISAFKTGAKSKPVMRAPARAELRKMFLGQGGSALELVARKHCPCDLANAELGKKGSLTYKSHESAKHPDNHDLKAWALFPGRVGAPSGPKALVFGR